MARRGVSRSICTHMIKYANVCIHNCANVCGDAPSNIYNIQQFVFHTNERNQSDSTLNCAALCECSVCRFSTLIIASMFAWRVR